MEDVRETLAGRTARDIMTRDILTARADWPVSYLAEFLIEHGISGVPVVDEEDLLVGVASLTDIVRHDSLPAREPDRASASAFYHHDLESGFSEEDLSSFRLGNDNDTSVRDIMTPTVFSVTEDATVSMIAKTMVTGRIHRVLVTGENRLVGIIAAIDVLRLLV